VPLAFIIAAAVAGGFVAFAFGLTLARWLGIWE